MINDVFRGKSCLFSCAIRPPALTVVAARVTDAGSGHVRAGALPRRSLRFFSINSDGSPLTTPSSTPLQLRSLMRVPRDGLFRFSSPMSTSTGVSPIDLVKSTPNWCFARSSIWREQISVKGS